MFCDATAFFRSSAAVHRVGNIVRDRSRAGYHGPRRAMRLTFELAAIAFVAFLCASIIYLHFFAYRGGSLVLTTLEQRMALERELETCSGRAVGPLPD